MDFYSILEGPLLWIVFLVFFAGLLIRSLFFLWALIKSKSRPEEKKQISILSILARFFLPLHKAFVKKPFYTALRYIFHVLPFCCPHRVKRAYHFVVGIPIRMGMGGPAGRLGGLDDADFFSPRCLFPAATIDFNSHPAGFLNHRYRVDHHCGFAIFDRILIDSRYIGFGSLFRGQHGDHSYAERTVNDLDGPLSFLSDAPQY